MVYQMPTAPSPSGGLTRGVSLSVRVSSPRTTVRLISLPKLAWIRVLKSFKSLSLVSLIAVMTSPTCSPAISAGELGDISVIKTLSTAGAPTPAKRTTKTTTPTTKFIIGPETSTRKRFQAGAAAIPPGTVSSPSPLGRTKPPNGIQLRVTSVPFQVNSFTSLGG